MPSAVEGHWVLCCWHQLRSYACGAQLDWWPDQDCPRRPRSGIPICSAVHRRGETGEQPVSGDGLAVQGHCSLLRAQGKIWLWVIYWWHISFTGWVVMLIIYWVVYTGATRCGQPPAETSWRQCGVIVEVKHVLASGLPAARAQGHLASSRQTWPVDVCQPGRGMRNDRCFRLPWLRAGTFVSRTNKCLKYLCTAVYLYICAVYL